MSSTNEIKSSVAETTQQRFSVEALQRKCECEMCQTGQATTHNDPSHDQRLDQWIEFKHPNDESQSFSLHMLGGTTKCARVFSQYLFAQAVAHPGCFVGKRVLEVGAGSGLVGMVLARLGAFVVFTDQEPVLPLLKANLSENETELGKGKQLAIETADTEREALRTKLASESLLEHAGEISDEDELEAMIDPKRSWCYFTPATQVHELHWGNPEHEAAITDALKYYPAQQYRAEPNDGQTSTLAFMKHFDIVLGSDLIYAHENIDPLVATFRKFSETALVSPSLSQPGECKLLSSINMQVPVKVYLAAIERFAWESRFFAGMGANFTATTELVEGDIKVYSFQ